MLLRGCARDRQVPLRNGAKVAVILLRGCARDRQVPLRNGAKGRLMVWWKGKSRSPIPLWDIRPQIRGGGTGCGRGGQ